MQFTKPKAKSPVKSIAVEVAIVGDTVVVSPCESHTRTDIIKATLRANQWIVRQYADKYTVDGFTATDRNLLRDELIKAYQGTLNESGDTDMINAIVKALVIEECESRNDGTPSFGENFDAVKASSYDGYNSLNWKIEAARKIVELFR